MIRRPPKPPPFPTPTPFRPEGHEDGEAAQQRRHDQPPRRHGRERRAAPEAAAKTVPRGAISRQLRGMDLRFAAVGYGVGVDLDRKSTRLNSSHANISYAVFC